METGWVQDEELNNINAPVWLHIQNLGDAGMPGDFDELSQSSDTGTDDIDSPTSGYRHASLLIQKLDSVTFGTDWTDSNANSYIICNYLLPFLSLF